MVLAWIVALAAQGTYSTRIFGSGPAEFRAVGMASLVTAGMVGLFCYVAQVPLSRGFVVLTFTIGTPLLLAERYVIRKWLHRLRVRGRMLHRVVAVGGPSGITEIVDVLERERYTGYRVIGACLPVGSRSSLRGFPSRSSVTPPTSGRSARGSAPTRCWSTRGGYDSSRELRRIAWQLEGSGIDLVVVPALTDIAGPRIDIRPVAGLPLLHVEQPQAGEAGGWSSACSTWSAPPSCCSCSRRCWSPSPLGIKLDDGGPVFFRQTRVGRDGDAVRHAQVPHDGRRRRGAARASSRDRNEATACCSRSATTRGSPGSAGSCAGTPSTSCRSCSTCCAAR